MKNTCIVTLAPLCRLRRLLNQGCEIVLYFTLICFILFAAACKKSEDGFRIYEEVPDTVECISNVIYGQVGDTSLKMDILSPYHQTSDSLPVILFIHGGNWSGGSKEDNLGMLSGYAESGYLCASIDYRLSDEAIFPAQIEDCKAAIRFLRANAEKYNIDTNHIGVWGSSAGGHLAALMGASNRVTELEGVGNENYSSEVQACCDWYGSLDFRSMITKNDDGVAKLLGGPPQQNLKLAAAASPIVYINKYSAPTLVMIGNRDPGYKNYYKYGKIYCKSLKNLGIYSKLKIIKGAGHGFSDLSEYKTVKKFFDKQLK